MTRTATLTTILAALAFTGALAVTQSASAQDNVMADARAAGLVGEQADGYLGVRAGQVATADLRARVEQINIRRRAEFTTRAERNNATPNEMAASIVCVLFSERVPVGEYYRDETNSWRRHTAADAVAMPSWCPR